MIHNSSTNHRQPFLHGRLHLGILIILLTACAPQETVQPTAIVVVVTATSPVSTETPIPSATSLSATAIPSSTSISASSTPNTPTCTVLQDLNLRSGPGTAYNPPITALNAGTTFVPIGYDPQGVPGGPWVQARVEGINQTGWVSAGEQFVSCTIAFDTLPLVEAPPPPKGPPPSVGTGAVDGDGIDNFRFSIDYNPDYFVRMLVFHSTDESEVFSPDQDGRGIASVEFVVTSTDTGNEYYRKTESNAGYCIFGGGEPACNPWTFENGQYKWSPSGNPVEPGNYQLLMNVTSEDGEVGIWFIDINIDLQ